MPGKWQAKGLVACHFAHQHFFEKLGNTKLLIQHWLENPNKRIQNRLQNNKIFQD